jgi:D-alanyl-D-alanine dipeptidase
MKLFLTLCLTLFFSYASPLSAPKQLLVVTTENWSAPTGSLQRYERSDQTWKKVGTPIAIKLGRNGLGWGIGLHTVPKDAKILKKEGDGKSPAGIFRLRQAFGYAPFKINYPYEVYQETDHCVDDVHSIYYNKIVDSTKIQRDYKSHERMKFSKDYYKYGIVVDHNGIEEGEISKKGAGSCIFIHIKQIPTAGCTVMSEDTIKAILIWLDPAANPLLVQGTQKEIKGLLRQVP